MHLFGSRHCPGPTPASPNNDHEKVAAPSLRLGKTVLIVGHENNLRSLIMRLEGIDPKDVIGLSLPRAVPLAYRLDSDLRPVNPRPDSSKDKATGFLNGSWLGGDDAVAKVLERDHRQVYDTNVKDNLEVGNKWSTWR